MPVTVSKELHTHCCTPCVSTSAMFIGFTLIVFLARLSSSVVAFAKSSYRSGQEEPLAVELPQCPNLVGTHGFELLDLANDLGLVAARRRERAHPFLQ